MEYLTVSALNKYLKYKFDNDTNLRQVFIKGEISNLKKHQKGNIYFTLKDSFSNISAICLKEVKNSDILIDGRKVLIKGNLKIYVPYGNYSIIVDELEPDGLGELYLKLEALKQKLKAEGLFDFEKKKIKKFPKNIGVITSKTGAVIEDIKKTVESRYPLAKIILYPANVQGADSKSELVNKIKAASIDDLDCLIIGRGGGSIEDLWSFNEEEVVREIKSLKFPVISAVGHETDNTLIDLVSDLRSSTPTGAAMSVTPDKLELYENLDMINKRLNKAILDKIENLTNNLNSLNNYIKLNSPYKRLDDSFNKLNDLQNRLNLAKNNLFDYKALDLNNMNKRLALIDINKRIDDDFILINDLDKKLRLNINNLYEKKISDFIIQTEKLQALNPLAILNKGFSVVSKDNKIIKSVNDLNKNDKIDIKLKDGIIKAEVL